MSARLIFQFLGVHRCVRGVAFAARHRIGEEYLDGPCCVPIKMALQIPDRAILLFPDVFLVAKLFGKALAVEDLWMHSNDQHFLIVRTIEDANPTALWKTHVQRQRKSCWSSSVLGSLKL